MGETTYPQRNKDAIARSVLTSALFSGCELSFGPGNVFHIEPGILDFFEITNGRASLRRRHFQGLRDISPLAPDGTLRIRISRNLDVIQRFLVQPYADLLDNVELGVINIAGGTPFQAVDFLVVGNVNLPGTIADMSKTMRPIKNQGLYLISSGNNDLQLVATSGTILTPMAQTVSDSDSPNLYEYDGDIIPLYLYLYRDSSKTGFVVEDITFATDPDQMQDGSGGLRAVTDGYWTVQRVMVSGDLQICFIQRPQREYCTAENALVGLVNDSFEKFAGTNGGTFLGYLVVKQGTTDLDDKTKRLFRQVPQVNGENNVLLIDPPEVSGNTLHEFPDTGEVNDIIFCPENHYLENETEVLTLAAGVWYPLINEPIVLQGGSYIFHFGAEIGQTVQFKAVSLRFFIDAVEHSFSDDAGVPAPGYAPRYGFRRFDLAKGSHDILLEFGDVPAGVTGMARRSRFFIEKLRS